LERLRSGKLERFHGKKAAETTKLLLAEGGKHGFYAVALYDILKGEHSARCARGETFCITPKAMAASVTFQAFTRETIEKARDLLLKVGLIEVVRKSRFTSGGRAPTEYRFVSKRAR
jgi:hypothetical protein